ncbi:hypothetical protein CA85_35730 [Allorhodopirellula solitaria]|uniref:Transmembrane protein n=2 Tax=Allorhodopirellula solitaria TaxID=2527987 RepID=A0A5C5XQ71_9BACT|nr:hypothetical protein CA85_35730 [Allorhodopirellula solitaria]
METLSQSSRFVFWCTAPFLIAFMVLFPFLMQSSEPSGWMVVVGCQVFAMFVLLGLYDSKRFWWCWRAVGAMVFLAYVAYLIYAIAQGRWVRGPATVLKAMLGLLAFGVPGIIYAIRGSSTLHDNAEIGDPYEDPFDTES